MLRAPVIVFSVQRQYVEPVFMTENCKYDVIASAEDILDTWGPGNLIVSVTESKSCLGIRLCGGVISSVDASGHRFHWSPGTVLQNPDRAFFQNERVRIGALVTANDGCLVDEQECWSSSSPAFEILGVQDDVWSHDERQIGGQLGQYALLSYNRTKHKVPGTSLKTIILRNDCEMTIDINESWGLQVSFCTGIARRVPLRILMADLLPVIAHATLRGKDLWDQLNTQYDVINAFQSESVQEWLEKLPPALYDYIFQLMRKMLSTLESTGIDREFKYLTVAWVYQLPPFRCFRIPCNEKGCSWMRVLADSGDCATFAYISTKCLETASVKCRGPSPRWHSTTPLLETAVLRTTNNTSQQLGPLEHKKTYFFKKMNSLLQVTVERKSTLGAVNLYVSPSSIPEKFKQRFYRMEIKRNQNSRIRERRESDELGAEPVAILTKSEFRQ